MVAVVRKPIADGGIFQGVPDSEIERGALEYAIENRARIAREIVNTSVYYREEIPFTMFMAGSPGAGKTEISLQMIDFCEKEFSSLLNLESSLKILRIDPDEIRVIPPFLALARSRGQAARASFCLGVIPPRAIFGRS